MRIGTGLLRQCSLMFPVVDDDQEQLVCQHVLSDLAELVLIRPFDEVFLLENSRLKPRSRARQIPALQPGTAHAFRVLIDFAAGVLAGRLRVQIFRIALFSAFLQLRGTSKQVFLATLKGVQSEIFCTPMLILMNGWDMTIKKIAGTDRAFDASIRQIS